LPDQLKDIPILCLRENSQNKNMLAPSETPEFGAKGAVSVNYAST
jgi:hypothetical protein